MMRYTILAAALLAPAAAHAESPRVGDSYQLQRQSISSQQTNDGSSSSSSNRDALLARVVAVREDGVEMEYDLPNASAADRARNWSFPARILKPASGPLRLLNAPELEARLGDWLKAARLTRAACGHWAFGWNAVRIECDPQSVVRTVEAFDPGPDGLREGAPWRDAAARAPASLVRKSAGTDGARLAVELVVDPETVRRNRAENDVAVAEINRKTLTLDAARRARAGEQISGTITIIFDTDSVGQVKRRTRVTRLQIKQPGGRIEDNTTTETVERRNVGRPAPDPNSI